MRSKLQGLIDPLIVSWGTHPTPDIATGSRFIDILQWTGTKDPAAALALPAAIQFMNDHNWERVRWECHALLRQVIEQICDLTRLSPLYPLDSDFYSQMGIAPLPKSDLPLLKRRLYDEYQLEVPRTEWGSRQFIRVSLQGYNTQEDVDALMQALEALLPQAAV